MDTGLRPLHSEQGFLLRMVAVSLIESAAPHLRVLRNRRGHVTRAYLRADQSLDCRPASKIGLAFQQALDSGHVWALRGVEGS